jgi:uncharacterized protein YllA (UPF0747 family)
MTDVRILSEPLGGSPLSLLLQRGGAPGDWIPATPVGTEAWRRRVSERAAEADWRASWNVLQPAIAATGAAAERLGRVRRAGGVVVTTGQQPGLFGGPIYSWTKAMGALALADAIEAATGVPTAAVFWAATDDADFDEAASTVIARVGGAERLRQSDAPPPGTPMSLAPLGDIESLLAALSTACGSGADPRPLAAAQRAYSEAGRTVGRAYVELLRELLAPLGVPVLDASHPAVAAASASTLRDALSSATAIERALAERARELRAAGFEPQVDDMPGLSPVFGRVGTIKRRLAIGELADDSVVLTPNVLLRPIVEHELMPTVAYWAGPGELAYFAQVSAVASAMGRAAPHAVPRWSCTLLEPHVVTVLQRLGLQKDDLSTPHAAERRIAREAMDAHTASGIAALRAQIAEISATLGPEPGALGLDAVVRGATASLQHRVDRLERRLLAGIARRERSRMRDLGTARGALYPFGEKQERALNLLPILSRHGVELLDELRVAAGGHAAKLIGVGAERPSPAPVA